MDHQCTQYVACLGISLLVSLSSARPVDRYILLWGELPESPSPANPYCGNGNIGVVLGNDRSSARDSKISTEMLFGIGKNDFWVSEGSEYFNHLAAPTLSLNFTNMLKASELADVDLIGNAT